jgi:hypothetical protein
MVKRFKTFDPQLVVVEQLEGSAIVLTNEAKLSLYKKSQKSGYSTDVLEEVYRRGYRIWNESFGQTAEQFAFDRVNSFIAGGFAAELDDDLLEDAKGYKNPTGGLTQKGRDHYNRTTGSHLKAPVTTPPSKLKSGSRAANRRKSFCARMGGVKGPMRKPNGEPTRKALALRKWNCEETQIEEKKMMDNPCWKGYQAYGTKKKNGRTVPNCVPVKEEYTGSDPKSSDKNNPLSRMDGTYSGAKVYANDTPGQKLAHTPKNTLKTIKKVVKEEADKDSDKFTKFKKDLADNKAKIEMDMADGKPHPVTNLPTTFADRKALADKKTPDGVDKPNINGDIQRNINSRLAPVLGGLKQKMDGKFRQNSISRMSEENINEITTPLGTTGKRVSTHMKTGPVRNAAGNIVRTNIYKSASSRGGGGSGSAGGSGGGGGSSGDAEE